MLRPILVAGCGRSGKTAFLSLLGSDPAVAVDRFYPYENRYLTYFAKFVLLMMRREPEPSFPDVDLCLFESSTFGPQRWSGRRGSLSDHAVPIPQRHAVWLQRLWQTFSEEVAQHNPEAVYYTEKAPSWLGPLVLDPLQAETIYMFRDPRDVYISANAFIRKRNFYSFGRAEGDTDLDHARTLAHSFTSYCEEYRMSRHLDDGLLVRYAELVNGKEELRLMLERRYGIHADWEKVDRPERHQTAAGLERSVNRWQREAIPGGVRRFFEKHLREEMACLGFAAGDATEAYPAVEFRTGALDVSRMEQSADGALELRQEYADVTTRGPDFWMTLPFAPFDAAAASEVWVSLNGMIGDVCSLFWRARDEGFSEDRSIHLQFFPGMHWQVIRFRAAAHALWKGAIAELRLDVFNVHHRGRIGSGRIRWVRLIE